MTLLMSIAGIGFLVAAGYSALRMEGMHVDALGISGIVLICASEITAAIYAASRLRPPREPTDHFGEAMVENKLTEIHERLIKIQLAVQSAGERSACRQEPFRNDN